MASQYGKSSIDETPISPISPIDRRNSLEKHLQQRPNPQDLKDRHILLDINAAPWAFIFTLLSRVCFELGTSNSVSLTRICGSSRALQATALDLERQRATDSLKKGLEKRPEREELVESMFCPSKRMLLQIFILTNPTFLREHSSRL